MLFSVSDVLSLSKPNKQAIVKNARWNVVVFTDIALSTH